MPSRTLSILPWALLAAPACTSATPSTEEEPSDSGPPPFSEPWSSLFPSSGETAACLDSELRIEFSSAVEVGTAGALRVVNADDPSEVAYEVDLAGAPFSKSIGEHEYFLTHPFVRDDQSVRIEVGGGHLEPGRRYFVAYDTGVFLDESGAALPALTDPGAWSFTTRALPVPESSQFTVALDGSADYCTVQGAIEAAALEGVPMTIEVKNGTYHEIVRVNRHTDLTVRGEDREATVIEYANNDTLQRGGGTASRSLFTVENTPAFTLENLTLHNSTPEGGSQAEALGVQPGVRAVLRDATLSSLQDTMMMNGRAYIENVTIEGNVDYIWGTGAAFVTNAELRTVRRAGYTVQARTLATSPGFVFVNTRLTADEGLSGHYLGRIEVDRFPDSRVAYVDCELGSHIDPEGWLVTPIDADVQALRFQEFGSHDPEGNPVDPSARHPASRQLTEEEAAELRDPEFVLGWGPEE